MEEGRVEADVLQAATQSITWPCLPSVSHACLSRHPSPAATVPCALRREQYSAERMNLVLLGGEPLDTLQQVGLPLPPATSRERVPSLVL